AWTQLCASQFMEGGGSVPNNPRLNEAIETCTAGAAAAPHSLNSLTLLIILKSIRGDVAQFDWDRLRQRIETVPMTRDNARIYIMPIYHARNGVNLDKEALLHVLDALNRRSDLGPLNLSYIGYFVMNDLGNPDSAIPYFIK